MSTDNVSPKSESLETPTAPASPPAPPAPGVLRGESCVGKGDGRGAASPADTSDAATPTGSPDPKKPDEPAGEDASSPPDVPQVNLLTVPVENEQVALNVIIGFLGVAQRRGVFALNESAKIYECVQAFRKAPVSE